MTEKCRILLAEDERTLRSVTTIFLQKNGYDVDAVADGYEAIRAIDRNRYDLIILDIMMPGKTGLEVCKYVRSKFDVPVVFLTALNTEDDIVSGYEIGADEYITKPFSTGILLAKVGVLIRRYRGLMVKKGLIHMDELEIEPARRLVKVDGKIVTLAHKEYALLIYLVENKGIILSREQILDRVWGADYDGYDRAVDTHIKKLRKALGKAGTHVETVVKAGYVWK
ncbi:MAG: response regulator transcription factor [Lachnospiraceae bacterium]|nr:response regulator transcription factor [Lachnospiraceae bacterium]